ncbi:hypothetical protein BDV12DRAFT_167703 [Aspergillus spectabilis]
MTPSIADIPYSKRTQARDGHGACNKPRFSVRQSPQLAQESPVRMNIQVPSPPHDERRWLELAPDIRGVLASRAALHWSNSPDL